jgi:hypothetical protein
MALDRDGRNTVSMLLAAAIYIGATWFAVHCFHECRRAHTLLYCVAE